jgi:hypothetical protein
MQLALLHCFSCHWDDAWLELGLLLERWGPSAAAQQRGSSTGSSDSSGSSGPVDQPEEEGQCSGASAQQVPRDADGGQQLPDEVLAKAQLLLEKVRLQLTVMR